MFAVVFEVHPDTGKKDAYLALAKEMKPILESIDGFIDNERFESRRRPGWVLSLSTWRDEKSVIRWRTEAKHHLTQGKGRGGIFADYRLRVGEITSDDHPPPGLAVREQRFDETETGDAKALTVTEVSGAGSGDALQMVGLDAAAPGMLDHDVFDSITNTGKILVRASWATAEAAHAFRPLGATGGMRHRAMRVIRAYAMFDRREAPQYHPAVPRPAPSA